MPQVTTLIKIDTKSPVKRILVLDESSEVQESIPVRNINGLELKAGSDEYTLTIRYLNIAAGSNASITLCGDKESMQSLHKKIMDVYVSVTNTRDFIRSHTPKKVRTIKAASAAMSSYYMNNLRQMEADLFSYGLSLEHLRQKRNDLIALIQAGDTVELAFEKVMNQLKQASILGVENAGDWGDLLTPELRAELRKL